MNKTCLACVFYGSVPGMRFVDCKKKTLFGLIDSGKWIPFDEPVCFAMPAKASIAERNLRPCSLFEARP